MARLFRIGFVCALLAAVSVVTAVAQYPGQITTTKRSINPRAVAVFEFTGDVAKPIASRLVPVSYFYAGAYEDAGIYLSQPAPVALMSGTQYELQRAGVPAGLYEVDTAGRIADAWIGFGDLKTPRAEKSARAGVSTEDEDRPHLTRSAPAAAGAAAPDKSTATGPGKPEPASDETATATKSSPLDDENRPTLKRKAAPVGQQQEVPEEDTRLDDPDRPRMQREQKVQERAGAKHLIGNPPDMRQMVAVSDATTREPHPFAYTWNSAEDQAHAEQKLTAAVEGTLAPASPSTPPGAVARRAARGSRVAKAPQGRRLTDVHIASFALTYENTPVLILSAKTSAKDGTPLSVTAIAEVDIYNEPRILLTAVSDAARGGDQPEMHLIDAVDADGSNRASLLFELRGATDRQFALYRVTPGTAVRTFVTGPVPYAPPVPAAAP